MAKQELQLKCAPQAIAPTVWQKHVNHLLVLQEQMELAKGQVAAAATGVKAHDVELAACQQRLNKLQAEAQAAEQAADLEHAKQATLQAELTELQGALYTKQATLQALQTSHMHAQLGVQSLSEQNEAAAVSSQHHQQAGSSKLDAAVSSLMQQESLQGKFYGRLPDLATVPAAQDGVAVNAVLKELCNLGSCLVVSDRQTAAQVISHFKANRVGKANCKITVELTKYDRVQSTILNAEEGLRPLIALIQVLQPQCQCVFNSMLNNWYLVKDRHAAIRIIARDRKAQNGRFAGRSLVTQQGELFKADGEVVSGSRGGHSLGEQPYLMGQIASHQGSVPQPPPSDPRYLSDLQQCLKQQQELVINIRLQVEAASVEVQDLQQQCAALESALKQTSTPPLSRRKAGRSNAKRQSELAAQQQMQAHLQLELKHAAQQKHHAEQRLSQLHQQHTTLLASATAEGTSIAQLLHLQTQGEEEQQAADKAGKAVSRRLALLETSPVAGSDTDMAAEAAKQQAETAKVQQQLKQLQAELQAALRQQEAAQDALRKWETRSSQCARAHAVAGQQAAKVQEAVSGLQRSLHADKAKRDKIMTALAAQSQQDSEQQESQQEEEDIQPQRTGCKRLKKKHASHTQARSRHGIILSDSDSDTHMEIDREGCDGPSIPAPHKAPGLRAAASRASTGRRRRARADAMKNRADDMDWESEAAELAEEEASLDALKAGIDVAALEQDVAAALCLQDLAAQLAQKEAALTRLHEEKQALEAERLTNFCSAMKAVNGKIGPIYQKLTAGQGAAYLTFTEDALLLFAEGVHFHVRPDAHRSRPFALLSGGQQALATLALSFALQAAFPSPFYFFDEIDSALDTSNASRVADYIASQTGAQYLVVSHKPQVLTETPKEQHACFQQVYERASCLVGVYTSYGSSKAVTLHVPEE
ncbi:hypothetical protein ABBQ32_000288 [Trebouxia sp. C0010 RCD-2024]